MAGDVSPLWAAGALAGTLVTAVQVPGILRSVQLRALVEPVAAAVEARLALAVAGSAFTAQAATGQRAPAEEGAAVQADKQDETPGLLGPPQPVGVAEIMVAVAARDLPVAEVARCGM